MLSFAVFLLCFTWVLWLVVCLCLRLCCVLRGFCGLLFAFVFKCFVFHMGFMACCLPLSSFVQSRSHPEQARAAQSNPEQPRAAQSSPEQRKQEKIGIELTYSGQFRVPCMFSNLLIARRVFVFACVCVCVCLVSCV